MESKLVTFCSTYRRSEQWELIIESSQEEIPNWRIILFCSLQIVTSRTITFGEREREREREKERETRLNVIIKTH